MTTVARKILKGWVSQSAVWSLGATIIYVITGVMKSKQRVTTFTLMAWSLFLSTGSVEMYHRSHIPPHVWPSIFFFFTVHRFQGQRGHVEDKWAISQCQLPEWVSVILPLLLALPQQKWTNKKLYFVIYIIGSTCLVSVSFGSCFCLFVCCYFIIYCCFWCLKLKRMEEGHSVSHLNHCLNPLHC